MGPDAKHDRHGDVGQTIVSSISRKHNQFSVPNQSASIVVTSDSLIFHLSLLTSLCTSLLSLLSLLCFTLCLDSESFTILRHYLISMKSLRLHQARVLLSQCFPRYVICLPCGSSHSSFTKSPRHEIPFRPNFV